MSRLIRDPLTAKQPLREYMMKLESFRIFEAASLSSGLDEQQSVDTPIPQPLPTSIFADLRACHELGGFSLGLPTPGRRSCAAHDVAGDPK
jgi:hypothetical protein